MGLFKFRWLHRIIRRKTRRIDPEVAFSSKQKLSFAYMIVGWNALGLVGYMCYKGKMDLAAYYGLKTDEELSKSSGEYYADNLSLSADRGKIITISGFKIKEIKDHVRTPATRPKASDSVPSEPEASVDTN